MFGATPSVPASSAVLAFTSAMFWERPSFTIPSIAEEPPGVAMAVMHAALVASAVALTSIFVLATVTSIARSLTAIAVA